MATATQTLAKQGKALAESAETLKDSSV